MYLDLVPLWAGILALAVFMYVLLDGFDLGVGILFGFQHDEKARDMMMASVAPIWDFNETWLVLGSGGLLAVFPLAFAIIIPAVYFPVLFMLLGLIFRGVAFEFRATIAARKWIWNRAFFYGSLIATFAQGMVLGNFITGFKVVGRQFAGASWDFITPFSLLTGLGLCLGYCLQGATWLVMKTEGDLQSWARARARFCLFGVLAFIAMVSIWTPLADPRIAARWFTLPNLIYFSPVPILTLILAWWLWHSLNSGREVFPFAASIGLFMLAYVGLVISLWPYVAPPHITLREAATAPMSQAFLLIGTVFLLPIIVLYVFWSYWVFRGKVRSDIGYHNM